MKEHGHDVTDEALIKRANTGIAPDGSLTASGTPPAYSSKFFSPSLVKEALDKTGPNTSIFLNTNATFSGTRKNVRYYSNGVTKFGNGVKSGTKIFEDMYSVEAKYELIQGQWKLASIHPIKP